jgi:hypothetical protein
MVEQPFDYAHIVAVARQHLGTADDARAKLAGRAIVQWAHAHPDVIARASNAGWTEAQFVVAAEKVMREAIARGKLRFEDRNRTLWAIPEDEPDGSPEEPLGCPLFPFCTG